VPDVPVAVPAAAPVVPVAAGTADESLAPDEIVASVRTNFASADAAAALLAAGAADVPVVPAAVEPAVPAVPAVPVAPVLVAAGVLALAVFAAEFDGAARRHPVTVTVFSLLDALGCGDGVVCDVGVCAVITAVAHAAIAAHKLICIVFFIRPPAALPVATVGPSAIEPDRFTATVRLKPDTTRAIALTHR
jgi:hypothetical protein